MIYYNNHAGRETMEIITAQHENLEDLEKLATFVWHESYGELLGNAQIEYMLGKFQNREAFERQLTEGYVYRIVKDGEGMIGYTASVFDEGRIFLSKLYLKKKYHGKGLGRMMIEDVISLYPQARAIWLTVNKHNPSYDIYRHLGFRAIDSVCTDIGEGYYMDDYVMQRDL